MHAPVAQACGAEVPPCAPLVRRDAVAVGLLLGSAQPEVPIDVGWRLLRGGQLEVLGAAAARARPDVRGDRLAEQVLSEDVDGDSPAGMLHALVAGVRREVGLGLDGVLEHHEFLELLDQRLLAVNVLVVGQGQQYRADV